jgi:signal transduction histidine kinase
VSKSEQGYQKLGRHIKPADVIIALSVLLIFAFLILARPPLPFLALLLAPIALTAVLYELVGGTLAALAIVAGVAVVLALDPEPIRRSEMLREVWPMLVAFLVVGPLVGWLVGRDRERERQLLSTTRQLSIVQDIVQAINTSLDPQETLQTIINETQRLIPFERAAIMLITGDLIRVVAISEAGQQPATSDRRPTTDDRQTATNNQQPATTVGKAFQLQDTAAGLAIKKGGMWAGSRGEIAQYADTALLCPTGDSCLIIPLQFQREIIGAFYLAGEELDKIPAEDRQSLAQVVDQTAIAIEHARLHSLERERAKALAAISEAGQEIAASVDLDRTLQMVMDKAAETLPMDAGALFVFDETSQLYRVAVSHNLPPEQVDEITFAFDEGVPGWVVKHRKPLIINDAAGDPRVHPYVVEQSVQSVLATPLISRERLVGVLNLFGQTGSNAFDDEALRLAQVYANQAAVFIENARLVEELRQAAAELEARVEKRTRELRETQAQVIRAEKMAAVGRLAASVAHEVNNPLQAIALHLQLVAEGGLSHSGDEQIAIVQHELDRIAGIVQRLLEFQRPKRGRRSLQEIPTVLNDVLALAGKQLQNAAVTVDLEVQPEIAPVLAAGDQLKQVFLNLILNAVEAMPAGGQLVIRARQQGDEIFISFADTGTGITPEEMAQVFEPFFSTKHTGSGLGLAVSHEIVTNHGGDLEASSIAGRGATFTVRLPAHKQGEMAHVA